MAYGSDWAWWKKKGNVVIKYGMLENILFYSDPIFIKMIMRKDNYQIFSILLFCIILLSQATPIIPTSANNKIKILVLHSYHKGFPWTDNINSAIEEGFEPFETELIIEYMDSKATVFNETYKTMLYNLYSFKYINSHFDLIISSDDNAITFLKEYHDLLFPGVPVVFSGINNLNIENEIDRELYTGVLEITDEKSTIEFALKIDKSIKKVYFIIDNLPSSRYALNQLNSTFLAYSSIDFVIISSNYSLDEVVDVIANIGDDSIVFFRTFYRDSTGTYFNLAEGISAISKECSRPIYVSHQQLLSFGVVGGKVLGGASHVEFAVDMAKQILSGVSPKDIPIFAESTSQFMFNYNQMEKFNIDKDDLPENSIVLDEPFSFYETYKSGIWLISLAFLALSIIIILSQIVIKERKHRSKILEELVKNRTIDLERAIGDLESFSYSVSHDLRAPLRAINSFVQIILEDNKGKFDSQTFLYFNRVTDAAKKMDTLIQDLLNLSQLGSTPFETVPFDFEELLEEILLNFQILIEEKSATIEKIGENFTIVTGKTFLNQILLNLIDNALKFVSIDQPPKIQIFYNETLNHYKIDIKDNGIGIDRQYHEKILEPFSRLHSEDEYEGTGIGLSLTAKALELIGGELKIESEPSKGSTFSIILPKN